MFVNWPSSTFPYTQCIAGVRGRRSIVSWRDSGATSERSSGMISYWVVPVLSVDRATTDRLCRKKWRRRWICIDHSSCLICAPVIVSNGPSFLDLMWNETHKAEYWVGALHLEFREFTPLASFLNEFWTTLQEERCALLGKLEFMDVQFQLQFEETWQQFAVRALSENIEIYERTHGKGQQCNGVKDTCALLF